MAAWEYKDQLWFIISFWILIGATLFGLAVRLYVRVHIRGSLFHRRSWHWSDVFLVLAWLGLLSAGLLNLVMFAVFDYNPNNWEAHAGERRYYIVRKLGFIYGLTLWTWLFLVKASLLCFFNELVARYSRFKTWLVIRIAGVIVLLCGIVVTVYGLTWCQPISRQWAGGEDFCWFDFRDRFRMTVIRQMCHVTTDIIVISIPLLLLPLLRTISIRQRIGVAIMFTIGLFCTISSIIFTLGVLQWDTGEDLQTIAAAQFLQYEPPVELAAAILIQCVPAIKGFRGVYKNRKESIVEVEHGRVSREVIAIRDRGSTVTDMFLEDGKLENKRTLSSTGDEARNLQLRPHAVAEI